MCYKVDLRLSRQHWTAADVLFFFRLRNFKNCEISFLNFVIFDIFSHFLFFDFFLIFVLTELFNIYRTH